MVVVCGSGGGGLWVRVTRGVGMARPLPHLASGVDAGRAASGQVARTAGMAPALPPLASGERMLRLGPAASYTVPRPGDGAEARETVPRANSTVRRQ